MKTPLAMIGLAPHEIEWVRLLVRFLRHEDPVIVELCHEALAYIERSAERLEADAAPERSPGSAGLKPRAG